MINELTKNTKTWVKLGILCLILILSLVNLTEFPVTWFDEGSHLHVPKTLVRFGVYADYSSEGFRYYGPTVGVGPTVFLPIALVFKLLGVGLLQARIVMAIFLLLLLYFFYRLGVRLLGENYALLAVLLLLGSQSSNVIEYGRQVLGEVPGMLFVLAAIFLWFREWEKPRYLQLLLVGLLFGLAMVTKYQYVIIVVPVLAISWVVNLVYYRVIPQKSFIIPGIIAGVVMLLWMGYQIVYLGPSTISENLASFRQFTSGAALVFSPSLMRRAFNELVSFKTLAGGFLPFIFYSFFLAISRSKNGLQWGVIFILIATNLGWYVVASISWLRYAFPGLLMLCLVAAQFFKDMFNKLELHIPTLWKDFRMGSPLMHQNAARYGLVLWVIFMVGLPLAQNLASVVLTPFNAPQAMAEYMDTNIPKEALVETWEPEMGFLTDHNYHFPPQLLLNTSVGYIWTGGTAPAVEYNFVQTERPAYVLMGEFSRWVDVYPMDFLQANYELETTIGAYELYKLK